jgi:hypothetical protein
MNGRGKAGQGWRIAQIMLNNSAMTTICGDGVVKLFKRTKRATGDNDVGTGTRRCQRDSISNSTAGAGY